MSTTHVSAHDGDALIARAWRYEIKHGPDGEANYAWVYDDAGNMVCTTRTPYAIAIVNNANAADRLAAANAMAWRYEWDSRVGMVPVASPPSAQVAPDVGEMGDLIKRLNHRARGDDITGDYLAGEAAAALTSLSAQADEWKRHYDKATERLAAYSRDMVQEIGRREAAEARLAEATAANAAIAKEHSTAIDRMFAAEARIATLTAENVQLREAIAEGDRQAEKLEALLDPHIEWEGEPK